MSEETKPRVLIVYHTYTKQTGRVADAMAKQLEARGCEVTKAMIELTDQRWVPKLFSQFPLKHPISQVSTMLVPQIRHRTGEIRIPEEAQAGDYDLVVIASPTWWIQTSMPIRSYLESPAAKVILDGKPFATVSFRAATTASTFASSEGSPRRTADGSLKDALRRGRRTGQVDGLVAWIHEARRATEPRPWE